eukprot:s2053_g4.t1
MIQTDHFTTARAVRIRFPGSRRRQKTERWETDDRLVYRLLKLNVKTGVCAHAAAMACESWKGTPGKKEFLT